MPDVKNAGLAAAPMPQVYTPYAQRPWPSFALIVRTQAHDPLGPVGSIRAAMAAVDRELPVTQIETMDAAFSDSVATGRMTAILLALFAIAALGMAAAGLYGVMAYSVERRTREIGVRVALGAAPSAVVRLIAVDGLMLTGAGLLVGTAGAAMASRAIQSQLFEVSPGDPRTYVALIAVFVTVAALACIVPVRRALRVDPIEALRAEA